MMKKYAPADPTRLSNDLQEYFKERMEDARDCNAEIGNALVELDSQNEDVFQIYCVFAEACPISFLSSEVIGKHKEANFAEKRQRLETLVEYFKDPEAKMALVQADERVVCEEAAIENFAPPLDFVDEFKEYLTPKALRRIMRSKAEYMRENMPSFRNLMNRWENSEVKMALAKLFTTDPDACNKLNDLIESSTLISAKLIDPHTLKAALGLRELENAKSASGEVLLLACARLGGEKLVGFAKAFPNVKINAELVGNLAKKPETYQN
jgi:hypothetical protein